MTLLDFLILWLAASLVAGLLFWAFAAVGAGR
jgi:hypothetical protein